MLLLTTQYCALGLGVWLLTYGVNRTWLTFKGFMS